MDRRGHSLALAAIVLKLTVGDAHGATETVSLEKADLDVTAHGAFADVSALRDRRDGMKRPVRESIDPTPCILIRCHSSNDGGHDGTASDWAGWAFIV